MIRISALGVSTNGLIVADVVSTNSVRTWEGTYSIMDFVDATTNSVEPTLHFAIYGHERMNENPMWYCGNLFEAYQCQTGVVTKLFSAETNIKGVTPVLQRIGVVTNYTFAAYWMLWRHPGNGGLQKYTEFAHTNNCFSLVRHLEFGDVRPNMHWYLVENEDEYNAETCQVVNGFQWYSNETIWENTNTTYRSFVGWP